MERPSGGPPRAVSDRELVLAFQAGDRVAYDEMFRRYHPRVLTVCTRILNNGQDAEEAAQETFLRAYQALPRFNGNFRLGAWLARIAANASVDQLRAKARHPLVGLPSEDTEPGDELDPEEVVTGGDPRLELALGDIKPLHARALAWRNVEGMSHQEIATRLEMSPSQVKALLHRARVSLRKAWDRAEGWALAPVLAIRGLVSERSQGPTSSPLLSASTSISPLLAERVAATALAVAVALGGFPSSVGGDITKPAAGAPETSLAWGAALPQLSPHDRSLGPTTVRSEDTGASTEPKADDVDKLTRQIREIQGALAGHDRFEHESKPAPSDPRKNPTAKATGTARRIARVVKDLVPGDTLAVTSDLSL